MNFQKINLVAVFAFALATSSCLEFKHKEKAQQPAALELLQSTPSPEQGPESVPLPVDDSAEWAFAVEPLPAPQDYQAIVRWPPRLLKTMVVESPGPAPTPALQEKTLLEVQRGSQQFQFQDELGQTYFRVENAISFRRKMQAGSQKFFSVFDISDPKSVSLLRSEKIAAPMDFVLSDKIELHQNTEWKFNRVFLGAASEIKTNGFQLAIKSDYFQSDNAMIESFKWTERAPPAQSGRSGGIVFIQARKAMGALTFNLHGEFGGHGRDGEPFAQRAAQGPPGSGSQQECIEFAASRRCSCVANGGNGGRGAQGLAGRPAVRGGDGGATGQVILIIEDHEGIFARDNSTPGEGGYSGKGGLGQQGGQGGLPGSGHGDCRWGNAGQDGDTGPRGADASTALNGLKKEWCFQGVNQITCPVY